MGSGKEMQKYRVKLTFNYSDVVRVEAESEEEAVEKALERCQEEYESFHDYDVTEE